MIPCIKIYLDTFFAMFLQIFSQSGNPQNSTMIIINLFSGNCKDIDMVDQDIGFLTLKNLVSNRMNPVLIGPQSRVLKDLGYITYFRQQYNEMILEFMREIMSSSYSSWTGLSSR